MDELFELHGNGLFLRRDALAHGYLDRDLRRALTVGHLTRVRHGAYVQAQTWQQAGPIERHLLACRAVLLTHAVPVALSHTSGAALHGMRLWDVDLSQVHLSRLTAHASRKHHDIAYHDSHLDQEVLRHLNAPVLPPAECALGAATLCSVEHGVVILDSALEQGTCSIDDLRTAYEDMRQWPGTARLRMTLRLIDGRAQSVGESRARLLFRRHHLPRPDLQFEVHDGGQLVGATDFAWPEHRLLGEFDGFVKYGDPRVPGRTAAEVVYREKKREDRIREITGWRFIRFTWSDLDYEHRTAERLRRALAGSN